MKKSRYSDEQIVRILREADKDPVPQVAKRHGVSEQSIYGWRRRFAGMAAGDVPHVYSTRIAISHLTIGTVSTFILRVWVWTTHVR